jgi:hypothetical protein
LITVPIFAVFDCKDDSDIKRVYWTLNDLMILAESVCVLVVPGSRVLPAMYFCLMLWQPFQSNFLRYSGIRQCLYRSFICWQKSFKRSELILFDICSTFLRTVSNLIGIVSFLNLLLLVLEIPSVWATITFASQP